MELPVFANDVQTEGFPDTGEADIHNILTPHIAKSTEEDLK
jgi:hypothetical protein